MKSFSFNPKTCVQCGTCVRACPKGLLYMNEGKPTAKEEFYTRCNNCGQCVAYCPASSSMQSFSEGMALEQSLPFNPQLTETYLRFLKSRRSNRNYLEEPVEKQTIEKILDAANYAPSGGNNRTLRWIVLDKQEKTDELRELIAEWFDTVCREHPVYSKRYAIDSILERYRGGKDVILRGAPHVAYCVGPSNAVWGPVDTGIALTYFNLACEANDIGCCFAGYATKSAESEKVRTFLKLKDSERAWCALCFGKKSLHPTRIPNRGAVPVTYL